MQGLRRPMEIALKFQERERNTIHIHAMMFVTRLFQKEPGIKFSFHSEFVQEVYRFLFIRNDFAFFEVLFVINVCSDSVCRYQFAFSEFSSVICHDPKLPLIISVSAILVLFFRY